MSLPHELLERIGKEAIDRSPKGLEHWCKFTSMCKAFWTMQLPGSARYWWLRLNRDLRGGKYDLI